MTITELMRKLAEIAVDNPELPPYVPSNVYGVMEPAASVKVKEVDGKKRVEIDFA